MTNDIATRQNDEAAIDLAAAKDVLYSRVKLFRFARFFGAVVLAGFGGVLSVKDPTAGAYVAAAAAAWCFLVQAFITPLERKEQRRGAALQERFDRFVFGFDGADDRLGVPDEDIVILARGAKRPKFRDWYATDPRLPGALAILLAQRSNLVWDRTLRMRYSWFALGSAIALAGCVVPLALFLALPFKDVLLLLVCPSLPALAHAVDVWRDHRTAASEKEAFTAELEKAWNQAKTRAESLTTFRLAAFQSEIFRMRAEHVPVPDLVHKLMKKSLEESARTVVARRVAELEAHRSAAPQT